MNLPLIIEIGTMDNIEEIAVLFNEYRMFYNQETNIEGARNFLSDRFEHNESIIFIAIESEKNKVIGFMQLYPSFSSVSMKRTWILNDLFVQVGYRKRGVAKLLLKAAENYAIQTKAKGLGLSTAMNNDNAQKLYESLGYKKDNEFYHYYLNI